MYFKFRPAQMLYILIHDSFNPECRQGILDANWAMNPYVHFVELDFIPGSMILKPQSTLYREMWGGFALAVLLPIKRKKEVTFEKEQPRLFDILVNHSKHRHTLRYSLHTAIVTLWKKILYRKVLSKLQS